MLQKFSKILKLVFNLKCFKLITKLNGIHPLGAFSNSPEASGVVVLARRPLGAVLSQLLNLFEASMEVHGRIPSSLHSFLNISINSSEELTLLEQRSLSPLLRVALLVVFLPEL